jgi:hypothetical protein
LKRDSCGDAAPQHSGACRETRCAVYFDRVDFKQVWCSGYYTNGE